ncbi:maleylpyruvate isomerase family mycothiol-dependent enzyme [Nocardioides humilatus]|uniref:Maleylpyruvate isomerase family mycothiol-dependent enzyme n=1 Tax=Nocardioides humilatus TaxID=2607660 RepID=A0A5B1L3N6_9ACTN|nr:maleylpyruvate isomerase family mycothiol-dependent enzyme [Nocardioides humilatus]KAA1415341.1 maleylpyruvate isomerase family mycothiol-dependent enzyme [Nocardioides humilatus]
MIATTPPSTDGIVRPQLPRRLAMRLAADEYRRMADALAALGPDDWSRPTPCAAWDVRQLGCHMVGMAAMVATPWEMKRQQDRAAADAAAQGIPGIDALTGLQVTERADWTPEDVVRGARSIGPRGARGRKFTPGLIRRRAFPDVQVVNGTPERWVIGFLSDVILTRDPWMHRMDIAAATGTTPYLTAEHDGAIIADVVAEWSRRHDAAYELELTGPAGGHWHRGTGGEKIVMDAVDFCRAISGRGEAPGLLAVEVPF